MACGSLSYLGSPANADEIIQTGKKAIGKQRVETKPPRGLADYPLLFRSKQILNTPVVNNEQHELGQIEDLVIDVRSGSVRYAALGITAPLKQRKLFAVPWNKLDLQRGAGGMHLVFDISRQGLNSAPGFSPERWPHVANRKWADTIDVYYGVIIKRGDLKSDFGTSARPVDAVPHLMRSNDVKGLPVTDPNGRTTGSIEALIVDLNRSGVRYAVVRMPQKGMPDKLLPVPFDALKFTTKSTAAKNDTANPRFVLRLKHVLLGPAPLIDNSDWPDLRHPQWSRTVDRYFGVNWKAAKRIEQSKAKKTDGP